MVAYRIYLLDEQDHICGVRVVEAPDDNGAAREAELLSRELHLAGYEVWDLARRIARSAAGAPAAA